MCGACGATGTGWPERIAPLNPGVAQRRARVLCALLREVPAARRVSVSSWPGGGLRIHHPGGWDFAPSLLSAVWRLTARYGPLLPTASTAVTTAQPLPFRVTPEAEAVWSVALFASPRQGCVTLDVGNRVIVLDGQEVHLHPHASTYPVLRAENGARELVEHWAATLADFQIIY